MKRYQVLNIISALVIGLLVVAVPEKVEARVTPCVVCGEDCNYLLEWCTIGGCASQTAHCPASNADCNWDLDDNDDGIMCYGNVQ